MTLITEDSTYYPNASVGSRKDMLMLRQWVDFFSC